MIFIFVFEKCQNLFSLGPTFGPFRSAKYLKFGGESCEIRIFSCSIQETYMLRKIKNQVLLFQSSWEPNLCDIMVYIIGKEKSVERKKTKSTQKRKGPINQKQVEVKRVCDEHVDMILVILANTAITSPKSVYVIK